MTVDPVSDVEDMKEKKSQERYEKRLMRTSTFRALSSAYDEEPENLPRDVFDDLIEDTIEVNRARNIERTTWFVAILLFATAGFFAGWFLSPMDEPEPVDCNITMRDYDREVLSVNCTGVIE